MLVNKLHVFTWRVFLGIWFPKLAFWVKGHELLVDPITQGQIALSKDYITLWYPHQYLSIQPSSYATGAGFCNVQCY